MRYAIANQKGGSQKTSTVVNLGAALAELGHRVLLVDLDPQGSTTRWLGHELRAEGLFECLMSQTGFEPIIETKTTVERLGLIPSDPWLSHADRLLTAEMGAQVRLRSLIQDVSETWDYVFFDTPPTLGFMTVSALVAANRVLIPVESSAMGLAGVADLMRIISQAKDTLNPELEVSGVVLSRFDGRTVVGRDVWRLVKKHLGDKLFPTPIRENVRMRSAWSAQESILEHDSDCIAARDYRELAQEFLEREAV